MVAYKAFHFETFIFVVLKFSDLKMYAYHSGDQVINEITALGCSPA